MYVYTDAGIRPAIFMMLSWFAAFEIIGEANEPTYVVVYYIFKKQWSKQISMHFPNNTFFHQTLVKKTSFKCSSGFDGWNSGTLKSMRV